MTQPKFPLIPPSLFSELDRLFPEACPDLKDSDREVWFKAGERSVIRFLKSKLDEQTNPEE